MPHKYELSLIIKETDEKVTLSGELSDENKELLEEYLQYAKELLSTSFLQSGGGGQLSIDLNPESGMTVTTQLPPWDDVMAFLHRFRPILLQSEGTNFYKIYNVLAKVLDHPHFRLLLNQQRELFSGKLMQSGILINSEKVLFDWLNSHEYHRDKEKQEFIKNLHHMMPLDASKVIFLHLLTHKVIAVFNLAAFIRVVLGKQKSLNINPQQP